jgi:hypothetical protein
VRSRGARRHFRRYLGPRAETGIDQLTRLQPLQRFGVKRQPLRLVDYRIVEADAEPFEVLQNAVDMAHPRPAGIDILDAQQQGAAPFARERLGQQRRISMAEVEPPGRAGGEAGHRIFHETGS